jgi:hypothetical protein
MIYNTGVHILPTKHVQRTAYDSHQVCFTGQTTGFSRSLNGQVSEKKENVETFYGEMPCYLLAWS